MINRKEIEAKSQEFEINVSNVERDYIFGWLLAGIYSVSGLKDTLVLKGGNCLRKGYLVNTRFSADLDFSTEQSVPDNVLMSELNKVCDFVQEKSGVIFQKDRNCIEEKQLVQMVGEQRKFSQVKLYFKDFYGKPGSVTLSVRLDITQLDKIFLPIQNRPLIHPYSDASECSIPIRCEKLEEVLAIKLKCLLQRRHVADLFDFVYAIFINRTIEINRAEILRTFLKRTIYERGPGAAKDLFLKLPFDTFRGYWEVHLSCPKQSLIVFEDVLVHFKNAIEDIFQGVSGYGSLSFFPAEFRNPIIDAGQGCRLLEAKYDGRTRIVEPYSLVYKIRKDGRGQEYFYVYDRTGGNSSGPGIKTFVRDNLQSVKLLDEKFEPRAAIELSKAGEYGDKRHFEFHGKRASSLRSRLTGMGIRYVVECWQCGKRFRRRVYNPRIDKHKDKYGYDCFGRVGTISSL